MSAVIESCARIIVIVILVLFQDVTCRILKTLGANQRPGTHTFQTFGSRDRVKNIVRAFRPTKTEVLYYLYCGTPGLNNFRINDVVFGRLYKIDGSWDGKSDVGERDYILYPVYHLSAHPIIAQCSHPTTTGGCSGYVNVAGAIDRLDFYGDGRMFYNITYTCEGLTPEGGLIPYYILGVSTYVSFPENVLHVYSPGYGNFASFKSVICTAEVEWREARPQSGRHGFIVTALDDETYHGGDKWGNLGTENCYYKRAIYDRRRKDVLKCALPNEKVAIPYDVITIEMVRQDQYAMGRFWFLLQAGKLYSLDNPDRYERPEVRANGVINMHCKMVGKPDDRKGEDHSLNRPFWEPSRRRSQESHTYLDYDTGSLNTASLLVNLTIPDNEKVGGISKIVLIGGGIFGGMVLTTIVVLSVALMRTRNMSGHIWPLITWNVRKSRKGHV